MRNTTRKLIAFVALAYAFFIVTSQFAVAETVTTIPIVNLPNLDAVGGGAVSTIVRDTGGVTVTMHTTLEPGPHTLWLLVWNNPSGCASTPCTPPPSGGSDPPDSVIYAGGNLIISTGRAEYGVRLDVGDTSDIIGGREQLGLTNPAGGEVHAVLRSKGAIIPDRLEEQLSNFEGGCDVNQCANVQAAAHLPGGPSQTMMQLDDLQTAIDTMEEALSRLMVRNGLVP